MSKWNHQKWGKLNLECSFTAGRLFFPCWNLIFWRTLFSLSSQYATWDLAFHMIPFSTIDPLFTKKQLLLFLSDNYLHPSGQVSIVNYYYYYSISTNCHHLIISENIPHLTIIKNTVSAEVPHQVCTDLTIYV